VSNLTLVAQAAALTGRPNHLRAYATFLRNVRGDDELADKIEKAALNTDGLFVFVRVH
jgi:hypothetical protein